MRPERSPISRRQFLTTAGATAALVHIVPRHVVGGVGDAAPSEKLNLAFIGVAGRGGANLGELKGQNVVALCDVDANRLAAAAEKFPAAKTFRDFRRMLDELDKSLDGVVVSTPDHTHAVAVMAAIRRGKHVYCEKPLAHSIGEVRALMQAAKQHRVVTQLGNQGHSADTIRSFCEWIADGAIGQVHTVHAACGAVYSKIDQLDAVKQPQPVPPTLDWDLWLGPAQPRPYHPAYLPGKWRGWSPFGCGVIGDWVCHVVDPSFWALDLGAPKTILARADEYDPREHADTFPFASRITYEFPARGQRGPVTLVWFDGRERLPRPADLEPDDKLPATGAVILGDKGTIIHGSHGAGGVRLIPQTKMDAYQKPAWTLPRVRSHHLDWVQAIKAGGQAGSHFGYGGPLTEIALLGIIATRLLGQKLEWDGPNMRFKNSAEANRLLNPPPRQGWAV